MKKKLLTLTAVLCLICTMIPFGTDTASAYDGEPGDVKPTVTLNKRSCEFYTLEYDTYTGWTLDIYGGSDSLVCDVTTEEGSLYDGIMDEHVTITNVPDGAKVSVAFAGKYPAMDSSRLDSKIIKLSYSKTTYNGKAKKPKVTIDGKKQADLVKKGLITVKYVNNTKPGIAKVIIKAGPKANGQFEGETNLYFQIAPKKMTSQAVTSEKNGDLIINWNKQKYASGYHLLISESSDFEAAKTYQFTVAGTKYTSMAFKDTKSDTKYYVKIRSYRDSKYGRAYGAWSK